MRNPCCGDSGHVTNQGEKDFYEEFLGVEKRLLDAAAAGDRTKEAKVIDLCKLFGSAETPPSGANNAGRDIGVGRRRGTSHLTGLQSGGETAGRRAGAVIAGRDGRARNQEAKVGECGPGSGAAACQTGLQSAAADAEAGRPAAVVVRSTPRKP